jgi:hypothetical protein
VTTAELAEALRADVADGGWHYQTMLAAADRLDKLDAQVAAVHAALDQYEADKDRDWLAAAHACVATVAKAVDR